MSTRLLALNTLFAALATVLVVHLVRVLSTPFPSFSPPILPSPTLQLTHASISEVGRSFGGKEARASVAAYDAIVTRNLFSPNRSDRTAGGTTAATHPTPILYGVMIGEETRRAYLEDPLTKRVSAYKVGDTIAAGQVEEIERDSVIIKHPEGRIQVMLKDPNKPKTATDAPAASAVTRAAGSPSAQPIALPPPPAPEIPRAQRGRWR